MALSGQIHKALCGEPKPVPTPAYPELFTCSAPNPKNPEVQRTQSTSQFLLNPMPSHFQFSRLPFLSIWKVAPNPVPPQHLMDPFSGLR